MGQGYKSYFLIREEGTQLGAESATWGIDTGINSAGFYINSEAMSAANEQKFLTEIGKSGSYDRGVKRFRQLGKKAEGNVEFNVYPETGGDKGGFGILLKHSFGNVTSGTYSGEGTYLHTFIPQDDLYAGMTSGIGEGAGTGRAWGISFHVGREDDAGTIRDYPYLGNRVKSISLSCAAGEELKCTVNTVARIAKSHGNALSFTAPLVVPFMWKDATFKIEVDEFGASGTAKTIDSWNINIDNNMKEVFCLGTNVISRVVPNGQRVVTGAYSAPFTGWVRSEYGKWVNGQKSSFTMIFNSPPYRLEIKCPSIYYTGKTPNISSLDENVIEMPFQMVSETTHYDIKMFLVNTDRQVGFVDA